MERIKKIAKPKAETLLEKNIVFLRNETFLTNFVKTYMVFLTHCVKNINNTIIDYFYKKYRKNPNKLSGILLVSAIIISSKTKNEFYSTL